MPWTTPTFIERIGRLCCPHRVLTVLASFAVLAGRYRRGMAPRLAVPTLAQAVESPRPESEGARASRFRKVGEVD